MRFSILFVVLVLAGWSGKKEVDRSEKDTDEQAEKAKERVAQAQTKSLEMAIRAYNTDHGQFPDLSNLNVLTQKSDEGGPYIKEDGLIDPWGKPFQVEMDKGNTVVFTTSPSGKKIQTKSP
jgi:type II secretory pathway pseudopilin PulG